MRLWRRILRVSGAIAAFVVVACGDVPTGPTAPLGPRSFDLSEEWTVAAAAAVGFDEGRLRQAVALPAGFRSVVVARNGYLVHEGYSPGLTRESAHDVRSVTKTITSALVGIAIRDDVLGGVDRTIGDLLPAAYGLTDVSKRAIRLEHLLTMTSGFDWLEAGAVGYNDWIVSGDHIRYLLDRPLRDPPGSIFNYNSAATHLLGVLLTHAAGEPLPTWANRVLFAPLSMRGVAWEQMSDGYVNGGAGLDLRAIDLAKIGQLYLQDGESGVRQVVPREWVRASIEPRFVQFGSTQGVTSPNYGYLWWLEQADPPAYFAWGFGGQFLYVVPARDLVVVVTTDWQNAGQDSSARTRRALDLVADVVAAAG